MLADLSVWDAPLVLVGIVATVAVFAWRDHRRRSEAKSEAAARESWLRKQWGMD